MPAPASVPTISSRAEAAITRSPSRDERSPEEAYTHRGLTYPFGRTDPRAGEIVHVADGIGWARLPVPGSLKHVNLWLLDDDDGVAIVDTGLDLAVSREGWEALIAGPFVGKAVRRIIVTHFHPDHVGLAGWLCSRFGARLWMSRTEWLFARMLAADVRPQPPAEALAYWRAAGWDAERISAEAAKGWGRFAAAISPLPASFVRMADGDVIRVGARLWRVIVGSGHSPEHACLLDEQGGVLIAGDQVLPRITSNVSLTLSEPEADPLGEWLASIAKLRQLPGDLLVLPGHGEPFTGLHARLDHLDRGHRERLDALQAHLDEPRRATDCFRILFGRVDDREFGLATGEAMAHLRRLEIEGRAQRDVMEGVNWYRAC